MLILRSRMMSITNIIYPLELTKLKSCIIFCITKVYVQIVRDLDFPKLKKKVGFSEHRYL